MKFRHLASGTCERCRKPFIPVIADQRYHPLCDPDARAPLTLESWDVARTARPIQPTTENP